MFDHPPTLVPLPTRSWWSGGYTRAPPRGPRSPRLCLSHYRCPFRSYCLCPEASAMPCDPLEENRLCASATGLRMGFLSLPPGLLGIYGTNTTESLPTSPCCVCVCVSLFLAAAACPELVRLETNNMNNIRSQCALTVMFPSLTLMHRRAFSDECAS